MDYLSFAKEMLDQFRKRDAAVRAEWPQEWQAAWSETARRLESVAGVSREEAEKVAHIWGVLGTVFGGTPDSSPLEIRSLQDELAASQEHKLSEAASQGFNPSEAEMYQIMGIEDPAPPAPQNEEVVHQDFGDPKAKPDDPADAVA
jgi:hypothetical protein